jgi:hypothetical protein
MAYQMLQCLYHVIYKTFSQPSSNNYRITSVLKVETDIITNITSRPAARAAKLVIMYVDSFTTDIIILIGNVIMYWTYQ